MYLLKTFTVHSAKYWSFLDSHSSLVLLYLFFSEAARRDVLVRLSLSAGFTCIARFICSKSKLVTLTWSVLSLNIKSTQCIISPSVFCYATAQNLRSCRSSSLGPSLQVSVSFLLHTSSLLRQKSSIIPMRYPPAPSFSPNVTLTVSPSKETGFSCGKQLCPLG